MFGNTQSTTRSYMHAMRAPGQSVADAKAQTARFVSAMITRGHAAAVQGDEDAALHYAAVAMHAQMDATSPSHTDANGDPKVWRGMGAQSIPHLAELGRGPSADETARSNAALRGTWDKIFGGPK